MCVYIYIGTHIDRSQIEPDERDSGGKGALGTPITQCGTRVRARCNYDDAWAKTVPMKVRVPCVR